MTVHEKGSAAPGGRSYRRLLGGMLLVVLLFELSMLVGGLAAPLFEGWTPRRALRVEDPVALLIQWRQSFYRQEADPSIGVPAPRLTLRTLAGGYLDRAALQGKKVVLLFTKDAS